jgi:predicted DCC family thiol-disulfide oxidoreductase YuxK
MKDDRDNARPFAWPDDGIILYDGVCVLCSGWARFVVRRDARRLFRFTPIQSDYGRALAYALGIDPEDPDTNAVILDGVAYRRSDAALAVVGQLPRWRWTRIARLVPAWIRDRLYTVIARNRYRIFGRNERCDLGSGAFADRVITAGAVATAGAPRPSRGRWRGGRTPERRPSRGTGAAG